MKGGYFSPRMDHLTCYLPGILLLGSMNGMPHMHIPLARDLLQTYYQMYIKQPTGLAPKIVHFNLIGRSHANMYVKPSDIHNLLRPEFIESLYYFYALTGNTTYQDMGWRIFLEKYAKVEHGYTSIDDETLKYFYLLFSSSQKEIDLDKYVFNTEAHPLPIRGD